MFYIIKRSLLFLALAGLIGSISADVQKEQKKGAITLVSGKGVQEELPRQVAESSAKVKDSFEEHPGKENVPLEDLSKQQLKSITGSIALLFQVQQLEKAKGLKLYQFRRLLKGALQKTLADKKFDELLEEIVIADHFGIPELERVYAATIAARIIKDKGLASLVKEKLSQQTKRQIATQAYFQSGRIYGPLERDFKGVSISDLLEYDLVPAIEKELRGDSLTLMGKYISDLHGLQDIPDIKKVVVLNLDYNWFTSLKAEGFVGLEKLTDLYLSHNPLTRIAADSFRGLGGLRQLNLSHNQLRNIEADSFAGLVNLYGLYLSYNQLRSIETGTFAGLVNLGDLDLENNLLDNAMKMKIRKEFIKYNPKGWIYF